LKEIAERQAQQHRRNVRIVKDAQNDQRQQSIFDAILSPGSGNTPWYPALRLGNQKRIADALRSEKRIAVQNANTAYQRYQENPTRLNLLVSKYSDLNADLKDASHHFNVVNSGTFGQRLSGTSSLFGIFGSAGLTSILVQRKERDELEDIQDRMRRVASQIQTEVRVQTSAKSGTTGASANLGVTQGQQGSVAQRMVALNSYGRPAAQRG
jgi:Trp operon repressor